MKHFFRKKWVWGSLAIIVVLGLVFPFVSHAAIWDAFSPTTVITTIFKVSTYVLTVLIGFLFMFAAWMLEIMMNINSTVLNPSANTIIGIGWPIARDIANLGFVIVMIIIAVATIVRYREYGAKQLLPKLIAAAIIVNFSLTIMAVFVNFSNVVTNFFEKQGYSESGGSSMSEALANAFGPQRFLIDDQNPVPTDPEEEVGALTSLTSGVLNSIAGLFFSMIFTLLSAFVFLAFAFLLLLRFLYLTFLAILSPLVWLFWVFPPLRGQYSQWWRKFISWTFFAPAATFFMYLSLASLRGLSESSFAGTSPSAYFGASVIGGVMQQGVQMIIVAGIMLGGLLISEKMGITGAAAMTNLAKGAGAGLRKYAGARSLQGLKAISETKTAQGFASVAGKAGARLQKLGKGFEINKPEYDATGKQIGGDGLMARIAKRATNTATFGLGLRPSASLYGGALTETEKGVKSLASREKIKVGSMMGTMLSGAGEKAGWIKKAEKEKEPMKQSEKEKGMKELGDMQSSGVISSAALNTRRMKIYGEMDYSDAPLVEKEIGTLAGERAKIAANLAAEKAKGASADKDKVEGLQQSAKFNQSQQEALVGKVQDEKTALSILDKLHGERRAGYDPDVLSEKVLDSQMARLLNQIKSSDSAATELQRLHGDKSATNYGTRTDKAGLDAQIRTQQGKLEEAGQIKEEMGRVLDEKKRPGADQKELDRQAESLMDRYAKELGEPHDVPEMESRMKEYEALRTEYVKNRYDTAALDDEMETLRGRIRKEQEYEKKRFGAERKWEAREKEVQTQRDQYIVSGQDTSTLDAELEEIRKSQEKLLEMRTKKPQGASGWEQRIKDLNNEIGELGKLKLPANDETIKELEQLIEEAKNQKAKQKTSPTP